MHSTMQHEEDAGGLPGAARREKLTPFFFREPARQLYACHHFPSFSSAGAALLCNATGHEYERSHKAVRQLAVQLARADHHVLRFDYYGTGDSSGSSEDGSLECWRDDIGDAIDECRRLTGCEHVTLIGLRLGATLAAQTAAERDDVDGLILYAPVTDAEALFADWKQAQAEHDRAHGRSAADPALDEVLGFPVTEAFRNELREGLSLGSPTRSLRRALVLYEAGREAHDRWIVDTLGSSGASVTAEMPDAPAIWHREPMEAIVPFKLIRRMVRWIQEGRS